MTVFVDSGAFSEVEFEQGARREVRPLPEDHWTGCFLQIQAIAAYLEPGRVWFVTPDAVGDQAETLRRAARWAPSVETCRALGALAVVPIQRGDQAPAVFAEDLTSYHGVDVWGVPRNKAAMTQDEFAMLPKALPLRRPLHFLRAGAGTDAPGCDRSSRRARSFARSCRIRGQRTP